MEPNTQSVFVSVDETTRPIYDLYCLLMGILQSLIVNLSSWLSWRPSVVKGEKVTHYGIHFLNGGCLSFTCPSLLSKLPLLMGEQRMIGSHTRNPAS
jgi:hypothetical protein